MIRLIVGLGNPGNQYEKTRHNIGQMLLDWLPYSARWTNKYKSEFASVRVGDEQIALLKPQTYMNLSGEAVAPCAAFFKLKPEEILVVHDELDLPYGQVAFKAGGGTAGHNGLKSIVQQLGSNQFYRLRMGIGRPEHGDVSSWVLSSFSKDEKIYIDDYLREAAKAVELAVDKTPEKAAGLYSRKFLIPNGDK